MLYNPHKRIIPCINTVKCSDRDRECSLLYKKQTSPKLKKPRFRKKNRGFISVEKPIHYSCTVKRITNTAKNTFRTDKALIFS